MNEKNTGLREDLRKAVQKCGSLRKLAAVMCVSRMTLARLLNGESVRRETVSFIKDGLKGGEDWEAFLLHMQAAKRAKNGFFASDWVLRMISLVKEKGESLRQIALKTGVCYVALHRLASGRAVSCVFIWEFIKKLEVYSPYIKWAAYKESCEYKELTKDEQTQYATATQTQYATATQTQYATATQTQYATPAQTQYATATQTQYAMPAQTQLAIPDFIPAPPVPGLKPVDGPPDFSALTSAMHR